MRSLETRLHWNLLLILAGLLLFLSLVAHALLRDMVHELVGSRLDHDAQSLLTAMTFDPDGSWTLDEQRVDALYRRAFSGHYYWIRVNGNQERSRSLWDSAEVVIPDMAVGTSREWTADGPNAQPILILANGYEKQGNALTIAIAEDISPIETIRIHFAFILLGMIVLAAVSAIWLQRWSLRRGFQPLDQLRLDLDALDKGAIRKLDESVPGEVRPLVREVNRLLSLLLARLERLRNSVGNLAHALKGPLGHLQRLADDPRMEPQLGRELNEVIRRLKDRVTSELSRARLAGVSRPGAEFRSEVEMDGLVVLLQKMYPSVGFEVTGSAHIAVDRDDMLELLGNLLDNAGKWANSRVLCRFSRQHDGSTIVVEDDGPGCDETLLEALRQRGTRVDESVAGHGLGLAIVSEIADLYGGELHLNRSTDLGGFRAEVWFPDTVIQR